MDPTRNIVHYTDLNPEDSENEWQDEDEDEEGDGEKMAID